MYIFLTLEASVLDLSRLRVSSWAILFTKQQRKETFVSYESDDEQSKREFYYHESNNNKKNNIENHDSMSRYMQYVYTGKYQTSVFYVRTFG